ncbi:hypothetical protein HT031_005638 [Scenedesmus sp. PABB004]|nr:hypothetical protein HT031_005638 [Scenedesmus sp. PABB004]
MAASAAAGSALERLDAEALDLVLRRLDAADVGRLAATCRHLQRATRTGQHAAHLWRSHCAALLGELPVAIVSRAGAAAARAGTWHRLYCSARTMDAAHWSPGAPAPSQLAWAPGGAGACHASPPGALLARTGHTATPAGRLLVLVGGALRDGPAGASMNVAVLDVVSRRVGEPRMHGPAPPPRRHHCTVAVSLEPGSPLHAQLLGAVHAAAAAHGEALPAGAAGQRDDAACAGSTLLVMCGLCPDGAEAGGGELHALWLAPGGGWGVWHRAAAGGAPPAPRAYACAKAVSGGRRVLLYGGCVGGSLEGIVEADVSEVGGYLLLCVYVLDANDLTWRREPTRPLGEPPRPGHDMAGPSTCPGPRKQAMCCARASPVTGHEELVVLGGCGADGLASYVPYALDLTTFIWVKGPVLGYLPAARDAAALMRVTRDWLLLLGGVDARGQPRGDVQRLHLPTLAWKPAPLLLGAGGGDAGRGARPPGLDTVDCTATCGVVVGGSRQGPYGDAILPRLEVLLPGPPIPFDGALEEPPDALGGVFAHQRLARDDDGDGDAWQLPAAAAAACHCGSCCGCLAARAAAGCGGGNCGGCRGSVCGVLPGWPEAGAAPAAAAPPDAAAAASAASGPGSGQPAKHAAAPTADGLAQRRPAARSSSEIEPVECLGETTCGAARQRAEAARQWAPAPPARASGRDLLLQALAAAAVLAVGLLLCLPAMRLQAALE